jgi:hypothetical protein
VSRTWILTGSPENHAATAAHDFALIGLKERNRNREHWTLAFPGQIRPISGRDAGVLMQRLGARAGVPA